MIRTLIGLTMMLAVVCPSQFTLGNVVAHDVEYRDGETVLRGYIAYDASLEGDGKRPGVLICHQWMGVSDHEKRTARELAQHGYVAFALDIYGAAHRPANRQEAGRASGMYKNDAPLLRKRAQLGLQQLRQNDAVDANRIAVIGFCFGGTTALELARSGARIAGAVSLHGGLSSPAPASAGEINARILVLHGADDPYVPMSEVEAFVQEMQQAEADWQMISYGNAVHSFTQPSAGDDSSTGAAYHAPTARRAWKHMRVFFDEIFQSGSHSLPDAWARDPAE